MPRLQVSRRGSLLATNLRNTFLEAFNRAVSESNARASVLNTREFNDPIQSLPAIARRVQSDLKRVTGRFFPIGQILTSIHALKASIDHVPCRSGSSSSPPTPKPLQIFITPTSPPALLNAPNTTSSMSRRRLACNIPALQSHLTIPAPSFSSRLSPALGSPASPLRIRPLISLSRRSSLSSGESTRCPVTPIDQIVHTPLTPPKIPRNPPPAPRTWARLNAQREDISPLASPVPSITPYVLSPNRTGRPVLNPLRIPVTCTLAAGDAELRDNHLSPLPRSGSLSPFEPVRSPLGDGVSVVPSMQRRPTPIRNNSASSLTRTALLRATSRPHLARSLSVSEYTHDNAQLECAVSPLVSDPTLSPVALASPFIIRSVEADVGYFRF
ncbi:hypothetical protein GY45DRAFT_1297324 [Cubamyces sp. BRFM 1775]|nr:hypothetical protein GY45DRAFT_1297324 [Cubamyces sp. BRFM 1775]